MREKFIIHRGEGEREGKEKEWGTGEDGPLRARGDKQAAGTASSSLLSSVCSRFLKKSRSQTGNGKLEASNLHAEKGKLLTWFESKKASSCYLLVLQGFSHFSARARLPTCTTSSLHLYFAVLPSLHPVLSPTQAISHYC